MLLEHGLLKTSQHDFPKMRGGQFKGRLELIRKFISFGDRRHPSLTLSIDKGIANPRVECLLQSFDVGIV